MDDCVFCRQIKDGSIKERMIFENDAFIAFLDANNFVKGHTLVIPKQHVKWVWDYNDIPGYFTTVTFLAKHLRNALGVEKVDSFISGESVPHAHIHLLPNTSGVWFEFATYMREARNKLTDEEKKLDPAFINKLKVTK